MSLNRVCIVGRLGADPEVKRTSNGKLLANMRIACEERWKDARGDWQRKTEWVPVVVWNEKTAEFVEEHVRKGDLVYVEGKFQTREWEKNGEKRYTTEVVLNGYDGKVEAFLPKRDSGGYQNDGGRSSSTSSRSASSQRQVGSDLDDEIPF